MRPGFPPDRGRVAGGMARGTRRASRRAMTTPDRPPWCGPLDDPDTATRALLARVRDTTRHEDAAAACGRSLRTWMRWWAVLRELVPAEELPARTSGGTAERGRRGAASRRARVQRIVHGAEG